MFNDLNFSGKCVFGTKKWTEESPRLKFGQLLFKLHSETISILLYLLPYSRWVNSFNNSFPTGTLTGNTYVNTADSLISVT